MSPSQLSKFERGETEIVFQKMEGLLNNLNITYDEFQLAKLGYLPNDFQNLLLKIRKFYSEGNLARLNALKRNEEYKYEKDNNITHKLNSICISGYLVDLAPDNQYIKKSEQKLLADYLFSIDEWSKYELLLFSNTLSILSIDATISLSKEMINRLIAYQSIDTYNKMMIQTLINVCIQCILKDRLSMADFFIRTIHNQIIDETYLYEKNTLRFVEGYYAYKIGHFDTGIKKMNASIDVFKLLDSVNLSENYSEFLNNLISEKK